RIKRVKNTDRFLAKFLPAALPLHKRCAMFFLPRPLLLARQIKVCSLAFIVGPVELGSQSVQPFGKRVYPSIFFVLTFLIVSLGDGRACDERAAVPRHGVSVDAELLRDGIGA